MNHSAHYRHATSAYRSAATAVSPLASVVMLYDGVIMALRRTIFAMERKCPEEAYNNLNEATVILRGLCHNLDFERGGKFAERMQETYMRLIMSSLHAFGKPDAVARLNKLVDAVRGLRDAWSELRIQLAKDEQAKS